MTAPPTVPPTVRAAPPAPEVVDPAPAGSAPDQSARHSARPVGVFPRHAPGIVLALLLTGIAAYRAIVIGTHGEPSGLDFGNWLTLGHQLLGHPLHDSAHVVYPPLVPVLAVAATHLFGVVWAEALLAGMAAVAPSVGLYVTARLGGARWSAVAAAALLAATSSTGEAAAWGGIPQLLGFGFAAAAVGVTVRLATTRSPRAAIWLGVLLVLTGATSHLVLAQISLVLVAVFVLRAVVQPADFRLPGWQGRTGWLALGAMAVAPFVVLVPLYVRLLHTVGASFASSGQTHPGWPALQAFVRNLFVIYREAPWLWRPALLLTALTPLLVSPRRRRQQPLWLTTAALVVAFVPQALLSAEVRLVYLTPVAVACAIVLWLECLGERASGQRGASLGAPAASAVGVAAIIAAVCFASWRGLSFFPVQRAYYGALDPRGTVAGLDWLRENTPRSALTAVAPENGLPFGWWVQGYGRRAALVGSDESYLNFPQERTRALQAVSLFSATDPLDPTVLARARSLHVQYLVMPSTWGGLSAADVAAFRAANPHATVFDNSAMVIVGVPPATPAAPAPANGAGS